VSFAAVVVIHDSASELERLLDSFGFEELVVVDTGSRDGGAALARSRGARVIELPGNPGFGAANNAGVAAVRSDVCVLVNPDVELLDDGLLSLVSVARGREVLLAPRLIDGQGFVEHSAHPAPGSVRSLLPALVHPSALPQRARLWADPWRSAAPRRVGWAVAACLVASTALLRRLGPFNERIFLFAEDMDLGLRAAACGVPTELWPSVRVRHLRGHATFRAGEPFLQLARSRREVIGRLMGPRALALDDAAQAITFARGIAARALLRRDASRQRAQLSALRAARGG
jgi:GT2 family glycosyltransferase